MAYTAVTHIGWPLKATRRPKPAKECAGPAQQIFKNAPRTTEKKDKDNDMDRQIWTS